METWRVVGAAVTALAVSLVGIALATNFRGVAEWHMRRSMAAASVLRRVPPWRFLHYAAQEERLARWILLDRLFGAAIAVVGIMMLVNLGYSLITGQEIDTVK
ncbi:hypothetical protein O7631_30170 [Micromonospora sp. WMMD967]|uniref:hypothetical protein n=1 Tax=Micromonospora sp. WMMD967 TaxID=3016101 RepID=UPI0024169F5F|nr:hypothetical protein [Micromonospora sp. WMMD967]MDG4840814.1 hypothetical protein [Micromonospora sp. WMMD967]